MIDLIPEGKSIGWMQAPSQWIFTHTVRFVGAVRIVIQDGEGFILIRKGTPLVYYFKHGRIELHGRAALDYFNSHPTIEFNLCKYTPEEFAEALRICHIDGACIVEPAEPDVPVPGASPALLTPEPVPEPVREPVPQPVLEFVAEPVQDQRPEVAPEFLMESEPEPVPEPVPEPTQEQPLDPESLWETDAEPAPAPARVPEKSLWRVSPQVPAPGAPAPVISPGVVLDETDLKIIGQIKKLNGIVAISVFNDEYNLLLMGNVEIEPLLNIARNMLVTTNKIAPYVDWGSFVHMTLQVPEGNVIIAPYREYHLCLLTTRTINIGHIRRILRDLQQNDEQG
jgi:hypothetical protein